MFFLIHLMNFLKLTCSNIQPIHPLELSLHCISICLFYKKKSMFLIYCLSESNQTEAVSEPMHLMECKQHVFDDPRIGYTIVESVFNYLITCVRNDIKSCGKFSIFS